MYRIDVFLYIARIPVEERLWKKYKIIKLFKFMLYIIILLEVNLNARLIEAFIPGTLFSRAKSMVVRIQAIEGKEGIYEVLVEASSFTHQNDKHRVSVPSEESSHIINQFINLLISVSATGGTD